MSDVVSRLTDTNYFQIEYCACYCSRIVATNLPFGQNYVKQSWSECSTRQHALHRCTNRAKIQITALTVLLMRTCYTPRMSSDLTRGNLSGSWQHSSVMSGTIGRALFSVPLNAKSLGQRFLTVIILQTAYYLL